MKNDDQGRQERSREGRRPELKMPRSYLVGKPMDEPRKLPARDRAQQ